MTENNDFEPENGGFKEWMQDNLRIIISIVIVIVIAGGIYSYSNRSQEELIADLPEEEEQLFESLAEISELDENEEDLEIMEEDAVEDDIAEDEAPIQEESESRETMTPEASSQETEGSFVESAQAGEGSTHLARRALENYLEKNTDSELLPEHKIYIEDYLRKKVGFQGTVHIGTSIEFSKSLIREAIGASKQLNDDQIKNLHKYAVMVPSLT